jgi:hypothetical protein
MPTRSRKPVSEKQLAANRVNAANSTGPRTPEGKARSAQNSRKHGFTASHFAVVRLEELEEVAHLRADLIAIYQSANSQELFAIERIALASKACSASPASSPKRADERFQFCSLRSSCRNALGSLVFAKLRPRSTPLPLPTDAAAVAIGAIGLEKC